MLNRQLALDGGPALWSWLWCGSSAAGPPKKHAEGEDDAVVRELWPMEARYERVVDGCLRNEHQNEWEELGVSSAGDGHARSAKPELGQRR